MSERTFYVFADPPTFDPTEGETAEDDSALIGYERAKNSQEVAEREPPEEYDREYVFWILEDGKLPDKAEKWGIVQHPPRVEVRQLN